MTRIDRYIITLYLRTLAICFASVAGLLVVIEVFTNLDEFTRYGESSGAGLGVVLFKYFTPRVIDYFQGLSGMLALLAVLFVISWLQKTNEFTALLAAGVTKRRVIKPLLLVSAVVLISAVILREAIVPAYADRLQRRPQDLTGGFPRPMRPVYDPLSKVLLHGRHLLVKGKQVIDPNFTVYSGTLYDSIGGKLRAAKAEHLDKADGHPAGYLLSEIDAQHDFSQLASIYDGDGKPLLLVAGDNGWLNDRQCFLCSSIAYESLRGGSAAKQYASTLELLRFIDSEPIGRSSQSRIQLHQRVMKPVIDWTVLLLGIPVLLTRPDRHMFWVAGACLAIVAGFTGIALGVAALGSSSGVLSPATAVWIPIAIFLPWAWARTQSSFET